VATEVPDCNHLRQRRWVIVLDIYHCEMPGKRGGWRDCGKEPRGCHGEAPRAVAIQLDYHAWRSQARDDKHVFC
jgi:hypothetical protein